MGFSLSKMLSPKGSGGVKANAKRAEKAAEQIANWQAPVKNTFGSYLAGTTGMSSLPSWMQTPDWKSTQDQTYNAFRNLGYNNANQMLQSNQTALNRSNMQRGFLNPGSLQQTQNADLLNGWTNQQAQANATALLQALGIGRNLRNEAGQNYWNMYSTISDPSAVNNYNNIADRYSQMAANQISGIGSLMSTLGTMYGMRRYPLSSTSTNS